LRDLRAHNQNDYREPIGGDAGPAGPRRRGAVRQGHDGRQASGAQDRKRRQAGWCEGGAPLHERCPEAMPMIEGPEAPKWC
jgi:hypothetical protein